MELKIEYLKKEELKPYANNAKIHTADQVEQIKNSIQKFGFNDPIAIWHDNEVIEGHGRLLAAMEMDDIKEIPVIRLDDLTDEQRRAYMLVHNKLTMNTGFDLALLQEQLDQITDISMSFYGFATVDEIADDLADFFVPDEPAETTDAPELNNIMFSITPKPEQKEMVIDYLNDKGYVYES